MPFIHAVAKGSPDQITFASPAEVHDALLGSAARDTAAEVFSLLEAARFAGYECPSEEALLLEGVRNGNESLVNHILDSTSLPTEASHAALVAAARKGQNGIVELLIERGVDVSIYCDVALRWAAATGHTDTVRLLVDCWADVSAVEYGALQLAAAEGHIETVRFLLRRGTDASALDNALGLAVAIDRADLAWLLVENGADVRSLHTYSLSRAVVNGQSDTVRFLLDAGVDPSVIDSSDIVSAARAGYTETVRQALSTGEMKSKWIDDALYFAVADGHTETARLLLSSGAQPFIEAGICSANIGTLIAAVVSDKSETVRILLDSAFDLRRDYDVALLEAATNGNLDIARLLIDKGADPRADGDAALRGAAGAKHLSMVRFLIDKGCSSGALYESAPEGSPARVYGSLLSLGEEAGYTRTARTSWEERLGISIPGDWFHNAAHLANFRPLVEQAALCAACLSPEDVVTAEETFSKVLRNDVVRLGETRGKIKDFTNSRSQWRLPETIVALRDDYRDALLLPLLADSYPELGSATAGEIDGVRRALTRHALGRLTEGHTSNEIMRFGALWHRPEHTLPVSARPLRLDNSWHPLFPPLVTSNGLTIASVCSSRELEAEGEAMQNCLRRGGYATDCLEGKFHILAVRDRGVTLAAVQVFEGDDGPLSTPGGRRFRRGQFFGPRDRLPVTEARDALSELEEGLRSGAVRVGTERGETGESVVLRSAGLSPYEKVTGLPFGEFPGVALAHFEALFLRGRSGERRVPFLAPATPDGLVVMENVRLPES